jgi:hypothetical protein
MPSPKKPHRDVAPRFPARLSPSPAFAAFPLLLLLWGCGGEAPEEFPPAGVEEGEAAEAPGEGLQVILAMDRLVHAPGDTVQVELVVVNRLDQPRTLSFRDGQRTELLVHDEDGDTVYRWSDGQMFTQALGEERFEPGDEGRYWSLRFPAPEAPGNYRITGILTAADAPLEANLPLEVRTP